jgi:DNA uptake protein ComE-like DNA-binding protein
MRKNGLYAVAIGAAFLAAAGCTQRAEQRAHDTYHDVFGGSDREAHQVDLNTATKRELSRLPGLSDDDADRIIANRPYGNKQGLLNKGVLGKQKYEQIENYVSASRTDRRD